MPYRKITYTVNKPNKDLIDLLVKELGEEPENGAFSTDTSLFAENNSPDIQEEETHRGVLHVRVIWNRWANIAFEDRGEIIIQAYKKAQGENVAGRISIATGLTPAEAERLKVA